MIDWLTVGGAEVSLRSPGPVQSEGAYREEPRRLEESFEADISDDLEQRTQQQRPYIDHYHDKPASFDYEPPPPQNYEQPPRQANDHHYRDKPTTLEYEQPSQHVNEHHYHNKPENFGYEPPSQNYERSPQYYEQPSEHVNEHEKPDSFDYNDQPSQRDLVNERPEGERWFNDNALSIHHPTNDIRK